LPLLVRTDTDHEQATQAFAQLAESERITHNYVVLEATALLRRRFGATAVQDLHELLIPVISVVWVDEHLHGAAVSAMLTAIRRDVSLVDWVSFEVMRRLGIETAFAFDRDFRRHGFATIP
jgi:uncharacterized protein